jgi:acid stress-induced BolA-like protein IbaG/YrbA
VSATDFRRFIELANPNESIAIECSDGEHIALTVFSDGFATLTADDARHLIHSLTEALGVTHG